MTTETSAPLQCRGGLETLLSLHICTADLRAFAGALDEKISQAPTFFDGAPVVLNLEWLKQNEPDVPLSDLIELIREKGVLPVAARGAGRQQQQQLRRLGVAVLHGQFCPAPEQHCDAAAVQAVLNPPKVHNGPVRSGQQLYAQQCDLIVNGTVSAGAEIIADGSIHVYGALRGRAIAGVAGVAGARICSTAMEAELVSIAGTYRLAEDLDADLQKRAVQIYLNEDKLIIQAL